MKMHTNRNSKPHIPVFIADSYIFQEDSLYHVSFSTMVTESKTAENVVSYIPGKPMKRLLYQLIMII